MSDNPRYCHKCKAWHSPTDAGWHAGCISELAKARERRQGPVCCDCKMRRAETEEDEICPECWNAMIDASNFTRLFRIACGWTVDNTGAIHAPNDKLSHGHPTTQKKTM